MNRYNSSHIESRPRRVPSGSLAQTLAEIKSCLDFDCFDLPYKKQAEEICLIIAEIFILPPASLVQIDGNKLPVTAVQEVYDRLTHEDIIAVMDKFEAATYEIRFKKTYIRTALYNEVFERSSRVINGIRTDIPEYTSTRREQVENMRRSARNDKLYP